jgi:hypothetical protein
VTSTQLRFSLLYDPLTNALVSTRHRVCFSLFPLHLCWGYNTIRTWDLWRLRIANPFTSSITKEIIGIERFYSGFCSFLNGYRHGASAPSSLCLLKQGIKAVRRFLAPPLKIRLLTYQQTTQRISPTDYTYNAGTYFNDYWPIGARKFIAPVL